MGDGSTVVSLCSHPRFSIILLETKRCGSVILWSDWPKRGTYQYFSIKVSGRRWIHSVRKRPWRNSGPLAMRHGRCGRERIILAGEKGPDHKPHRLQGELVISLATAFRGLCPRIRRGSADHAEFVCYRSGS